MSNDFKLGVLCGVVFMLLMVAMAWNKPGATLYQWCEEIQEKRDE
jgi:hypothetical protein